ncbi:Homeodomain-like protein [Pelagophyceae sp. CCMP2097]|nr:Homeodomain-like protein [Pelagophyceae sp. CCMP2097]
MALEGGATSPALTSGGGDSPSNDDTARRRWTRREDEKLRQAVEASGGAWDKCAALLRPRSAEQCEERWQRGPAPVLRNGLVKGAFTEEEDGIIVECMRSGRMSWLEVAARIPGRIGKQCRERWTNHLDPHLKKGGWTQDEDTIMSEAQNRWGNAWTKIAELLPGRAENAVKNRWNSAFRRNNAANFGSTPVVTVVRPFCALANAATNRRSLGEAPLRKWRRS